jgi:hypothetical protein
MAKDHPKIISHIKDMIKRLTGKELLDKKHSLASLPTPKVAKVCGYYSTTESGQVRVNLTEFYHAVLEAKNISVLGSSINTEKSYFYQTATPAERANFFEEWAESHQRNTPLLSDEAISRESIYGERG